MLDSFVSSEALESAVDSRRSAAAFEVRRMREDKGRLVSSKSTQARLDFRGRSVIRTTLHPIAIQKAIFANETTAPRILFPHNSRRLAVDRSRRLARTSETRRSGG